MLLNERETSKLLDKYLSNAFQNQIKNLQFDQNELNMKRAKLVKQQKNMSQIIGNTIIQNSVNILNKKPLNHTSNQLDDVDDYDMSKDKLGRELQRIYGQKYMKIRQTRSILDEKIASNTSQMTIDSIDVSRIQMKFKKDFLKNTYLQSQLDNQNEFNSQFQNYQYKQDFLIKQNYFQMLNPLEKANYVLQDSVYMDPQSEFELENVCQGYQQKKIIPQVDKQNFYRQINKDISYNHKLTQQIQKISVKQHDSLNKQFDIIQNKFDYL